MICYLLILILLIIYLINIAFILKMPQNNLITADQFGLNISNFPPNSKQ